MPDDVTPTTPIAFAADPDILFLGTIEDFPRSDFHQIPSHDEQRQTVLHAAGLIRAGVLAHALDIHRHVDGYILTDDPEATLAQFTADPIASSLETSAKHAEEVGLLQPVDLKGIYDLTLLNELLKADGKSTVKGLT